MFILEPGTSSTAKDQVRDENGIFRIYCLTLIMFTLTHYQHALLLCLYSWLGLLCSSSWVTRLGLRIYYQVSQKFPLVRSGTGTYLSKGHCFWDILYTLGNSHIHSLLLCLTTLLIDRCQVGYLVIVVLR